MLVSTGFRHLYPHIHDYNSSRARQGPAFFLSDETEAQVSKAESGFALAGLITCTVLFAGYLMKQVCLPD